MNTNNAIDARRQQVVITPPEGKYIIISSTTFDATVVNKDDIEEAEIVEEVPVQQHTTPCHHIAPAIYEHFGRMVNESIHCEQHEDTCCFAIEHEVDGVLYELSATLMPRRKTTTDCDGRHTEIVDVIPIWWELHSFDLEADGNEILNDARFEPLKKWIID